MTSWDLEEIDRLLRVVHGTMGLPVLKPIHDRAMQLLMEYTAAPPAPPVTQQVRHASATTTEGRGLDLSEERRG